jgi:predicted  nucleic acid-binding Zn-ribbon protein
MVEPNSRRAEWLQELWGDGLPPWLQLCQEPLGALSEKVRWYRYNDPRLDGPLPAEELTSRYRNLCLLAEEWRDQRTLDAVIQDWWGSTEGPPHTGLLLIQASDPEPLLKGASALLPNLTRLVLWEEGSGERKPASISETLAQQLENACFRQSDLDPYCWERDDLLLLRRELEEAQAEVKRLSAHCHAQREENALQSEGLLTKVQCLEMELQESRACIATLEPSHQAHELTLRQLDQLKVELHQLAHEQAKLEKDCEDLRAERNTIRDERDGMRQQIDDLRRELAPQEERIQQLSNELGSIHKDLGHSLHQRDQLRNQLDQLASNRSALQEQCDALGQERNALRQQRDELLGEQERGQKEIEDLRHRQEELAKMTANSELELALIRDLYVQVSTAKSTAKG